MPANDYTLLDFGAGRKLEQFGGYVLDRPAPAADGAKRNNPTAWKTAAARYVLDNTKNPERGTWIPANSLPDAWRLSIHSIQFNLQASPFGHVGVFPEQADNWEWIRRKTERDGRLLKVLNLFAYTGGSTLAAAAAGAEVTHVDAAKNIVARARRNAESSDLATRPIRWIVDDVCKFCRREIRRESYYDAIILDPPTYGHGVKGEEWQIGRDFLPLLRICRDLVQGKPAFVLATCHSPGIGPAELAAYLSDGMFGGCAQAPTSGVMQLASRDGRCLSAGVFARWPE